MIFGVAEIIHGLSKLWPLIPGDAIFNGTPTSGAALLRRDRFRGELAGVAAREGRNRLIHGMPGVACSGSRKQAWRIVTHDR